MSGRYGAENLQRDHNVSRETCARLAAYLSLLGNWNKKINLVGKSTLDDPWRRHILDSYQLIAHLPQKPGNIVDLGAGAGLPGLVIAMATDHHVHLVESDKRKAAFLRHVSANLELANTTIHAERLANVAVAAEIVTARAFASITEILDQSRHLATPPTRYLLLKGRNAECELTQAQTHWHMEAEMVESVTDPEARIVILNRVVPNIA